MNLLEHKLFSISEKRTTQLKTKEYIDQTAKYWKGWTEGIKMDFKYVRTVQNATYNK